MTRHAQGKRPRCPDCRHVRGLRSRGKTVEATTKGGSGGVPVGSNRLGVFGSPEMGLPVSSPPGVEQMALSKFVWRALAPPRTMFASVPRAVTPAPFVSGVGQPGLVNGVSRAMSSPQ